MPDRRLTQLPVLAALSADDIFYVVDDPAGAANSRQIAASVFDARYLQTANNLSDLTNVVVARASLGLGTLAVINSPLPIVNGGSGQVTQQAAIDALTNVAAATNEYVLTKDTATGNAIFKVAAGGASLPVVDETAIVYKTGVPANTLTFDVTSYTAPRIVTWPDAAMTVVGLEVMNVFTAVQKIDVNSALALLVEQNGVRDNVLVVDTASGRVGVGTDVPGNVLHVSGGKIRVDNTFGVEGLGTSGNARNMFNLNNFNEISYGDVTEISKIVFSIVGHRIDFTAAGFGIDKAAPAAGFHLYDVSNARNAVRDIAVFDFSCDNSALANFGPALHVQGKTSTTDSQSMGRLYWQWITATHASRKAQGTLTVYDATAERICAQWGTNGSDPLFGVLGATPVARQAHIVDADGTLADITTKFNTLLSYLENFGFINTV